MTLLAAGCGQKGPLYLEHPPRPAAAAAKKPAKQAPAKAKSQQQAPDQTQSPAQPQNPAQPQQAPESPQDQPEFPVIDQPQY